MKGKIDLTKMNVVLFFGRHLLFSVGQRHPGD